jgi:hypothetical protein
LRPDDAPDLEVAIAEDLAQERLDVVGADPGCSELGVMSAGEMSAGITARSAATFSVYLSSVSAAAIAAACLIRTLPDRYSAAGTSRCSVGSS